MPRFDGTGPWGRGPATGGGFGWCLGARPFWGRGGGRPRRGRMAMGPGYGGGYGPGYGGGYGRGYGPGYGGGYGPGYGGGYGPGYGPEYGGGYWSPSVDDERTILAQESDLLKERLKEIEDRIDYLEKGDDDE